MEHRLCSPSRTYSDMPESRKADSRFRQQHQVAPVPTSLSETERQRLSLARNKGVFVPSTQIPASLFRGLESPGSSNEDADVPDIDLSSLDNPAPGSSRQARGQRNSTTQRVNPYNLYEAPRAGTSSSHSRNGANAETPRKAAPKNDEDIEVIVLEDSDSDSRSSANSTTSQQFFKSSRLPYSQEEDEEIIKFVLSGNNIDKTSSIVMWKELETKKNNPKRTYQSLKNRFLRNIKPAILTKYRSMLTPELIRMVKRKFPELKVTDARAATPKSGPQPKSSRRVVCVNPSMENMPTTFYADRHFGIINVTTQGSEQNRSDSPSVFPPMPNLQASETRDIAVGDDEVMQIAASNQVDEACQVWGEPELSTPQIERSLNISAREKLLDVPVQTFKYYDNMKAFANKAAVNLKLILDRESADVLPADLPINVSVTVTIGKEEHAESNAVTQNPSSSDSGDGGAKKDKQEKPEDKKNSKRSLKKGYILKVKEKYTRKYNNECKWFARAANSLIYKARIDSVMDSLRSDIENINAENADNPYDAESPTPRDSSFEDYSQNTNCSTEDESCYTQTLKKVSHIYKVEVTPTQSLIEDEYEENISMNSAPTPPSIEDKESLTG